MEVDKIKAGWDDEMEQEDYEAEDHTEDGEVCIVGKGSKKRAKESASHAGCTATEQRNARAMAEAKARSAKARGAEGMGSQEENWHVGNGMF